MTVIGIAGTSGSQAEILCKSLVLVAAANDGDVTVLRIIESTTFDLPFVWPDICVVQSLSRADAAGQHLEEAIAKARCSRTALLDCPIDIFASQPALWAALNLLLIPVSPGLAMLQAALPFIVQLQKLEDLGDGRRGKIRLLDASASPGHPKRLLQSLELATGELDAEFSVDLIQVLMSAYRAPHWCELDDILGLGPSLPSNAAIEGIKDLWREIELALHRQENQRQRSQHISAVKKKYGSPKVVNDLAEDLRLIDYGLGPTGDDLAAACGLKDWRVLDDGLIEGRLLSPSGEESGKIVPTEVVRADPLGGWIRTPDKLLRLLSPAYPHISKAE